MSLNALIDLFYHNQKKCGTERVNIALRTDHQNRIETVEVSKMHSFRRNLW